MTNVAVQCLSKLFPCLVILGLGCLVSSCASLRSGTVPRGAVAGISSVKLKPLLTLEAVAADPQAASHSYKKALTAMDNDAEREGVLWRLANLQRDQAEQRLEEGQNAQGEIDLALAQYLNLLDIANRSIRPEVLYQLARTYSLSSQSLEAQYALNMLIAEFPASKYAVEARFRIAEFDYLQANYAAALENYSYVVSNSASVYWRNARYMRAWCLFKLSRYELALLEFVELLDDFPSFSSLDILSPVDARLATDTMRVMSMALSYLQGGDSITSLMAQVGARPYEALLYQTLAEFYQSKQRFNDSAASFQAFLDANPMDPRSPSIHQKIITTYEIAGFDAPLHSEKQDFVERYGVRSEFWKRYRETQGVYDGALLGTLKTLLGELANKAQLQATDVVSRQKALENYQHYIETFPVAREADRYWFLLGEVAGSLNDRVTADHSYQTLAYNRPVSNLGADAGYNYWLLASTGCALELDRRAQLYLAAYGLDERLPAVMTATASALLNQNEPLLAFFMSTQLSKLEQPITPAIQKLNIKILAHSSFALADYNESESQFRQLLAMQPRQISTMSDDIRESIAASIYRQSEAARDENEGYLAVKHLLRIAEVVPTSSLAADGQVDGAALLLDLQRWSEAEQLVARLKIDLSDHPRAVEFDAMYLQSQEGQQDWNGAATTLLKMADAADDPVLAAAQTWQAITYYRQAQQVSQAIIGYQRYIARFPKPVVQWLEALDELSELLTQTNRLAERDQALQEIISSNAGLNDEATPRTQFLAAKASVVVADALYRDYQLVPLEQPLVDSFKRKQVAMSRAVNAYQQLQRLGVAAYQGQANFRLGDIYQQLASELLTSIRPIGLDDNALAAYEVLLEEQVYPFEELAIELHEVNVALGWRQGYDKWVVMSLGALANLLPARYAKKERVVEFADEIL